MKTAEELYERFFKDKSHDILDVNAITEQIKFIQEDAYNQAIDDAAESAEAYDTVPRAYHSCVVDKQSILELKK